MAHFPDNSPIDYFAPVVPAELRAIGWLDAPHPYNRGPVSEQFVAKLSALLADPWAPFMSLGVHFCTLCRPSGSGGSGGTYEIFIPADDGFAYVTPNLILHYIEVHKYAPPKEFIDAVNRCPPMSSPEYLSLLKTAAPSLFRNPTTSEPDP